MSQEQGLSVGRACKVAKLSRAAYYRQGVDWAKRDRPVIDALNAVVGAPSALGILEVSRSTAISGSRLEP
jgi:putative transposase